MFTTGETLGLAEWIIDDTCLVFRLVCLPTSEGFAYIEEILA